MELKSLWLGILFSLGVFAVKTGVGMAYGDGSAAGPWKRAGVWLVFAALYGTLFALAGILLPRLDVAAAFPAVQRLFKGGMLIHVVMAASLLIWGVSLLKTPLGAGAKSKAWIPLVVPCPVCATVIGFSTAFLLTVFPENPWTIIIGLASGFVAVSALTRMLIGLAGPRAFRSPERFLGSAMVTIAAYFLVSVIVMPHFAESDQVFRLAGHSQRETQTATGWACAVAGGVAALFAAGYLAMRRRIKPME